MMRLKILFLKSILLFQCNQNSGVGSIPTPETILLFNQKLEIMFEIRKCFETKNEGEIVSYPVNQDPDQEAKKSLGYGIYQYREDGTQQLVDREYESLEDAVVRVQELEWPEMQRRIDAVHNRKHQKPPENGSIDHRRAAMHLLDEANERHAKSDDLYEYIHSEKKDREEWLEFYHLMGVELAKAEIDTLRKWVEENYYPI